MSWAVAADRSRDHGRCTVPLAWPFMSPSTFVEASDVGVVDIVEIVLFVCLFVCLQQRRAAEERGKLPVACSPLPAMG